MANELWIREHLQNSIFLLGRRCPCTMIRVMKPSSRKLNLRGTLIGHIICNHTVAHVRMLSS